VAGRRVTICPIALRFLALDRATISPVEPGFHEIMSALADFTAAAPARVETSCRSVIPAGGDTRPAPLLPKNPITTSSAMLVDRRGATIHRVFRLKRPVWPSMGAPMSTSP